MKLLKKKPIKFKNKNIKLMYNRSESLLKVTNSTNTHGFLVFPCILNQKHGKSLSIDFYGELLSGSGAVFQLLDFKRNILLEIPLNSSSTYTLQVKRCICCIKISKHTEIVIRTADLTPQEGTTELLAFDHIINSKNDMLIITPSYPTEENKYFGGFVHSRVKAYKEDGIQFDLVCAFQYPNTCKYTFEGIDVLRTNFWGLRQILMHKKYKTILLHFFDDRYAQVLDACDLSSTNLYLWVHGPETLYWDWLKMTDPYFVYDSKLSSDFVQHFAKNDALIQRYNSYSNVHWVFVSNWIKQKSEELIHIKFNNYSVIPNFVDGENFVYLEKEEEQRKKIFFIRRFENISKYAIDINVRTILELSRRDFFDDLEFNIYGTGDYYDTLLAPLKQFKNVHFYPYFMTHEQIAKVHQQNGIGLFATRYDAQGVSMCEAAMSGLAIVSSQNDAIAEFLPSESGFLCETEDAVAYADAIEKLYKSPILFRSLCRQCHDKVNRLCSFDATIQKEIDMIHAGMLANKPAVAVEQSFGEKVLSVIIPSYNVSAYLFHGVYTMLEHRYRDCVEIIIVNDGSKDQTLAVAKELQHKYSEQNVKIIDKPNGGHGSTINVGIAVATGKYIRVIDGDDYVNTEDFEKLVEVLKNETSDIVITDYCSDYAVENILQLQKNYSFMLPKKQYVFDDLCYEGYGFSTWGPILATANFKQSILKDSFVLTEKSFYIDMEFDAYSIAKAKTIVYYPLDIYRYFIGRTGQSISRQSYCKNYKQHEQVLFNLIKYVQCSDVSEQKKSYITNKLIFPMLAAHHTILLHFLRSGKAYDAFERKLKEYPAIYNAPCVATRGQRFHRATRGWFVKINPLLLKIKRLIAR